MEKEEILNEKFTEEKAKNPKRFKKLKISLLIIGSILVIAATILLLGYFKFNWFESEIYNLDIQISRNTNQVNYFTETKIMETKLGMTSGESNTKKMTVKNNFLVMQTSREKLENNNYLNTASLIILDVKVNLGNEEKQGISFNISDKEIIKDFKSNPDGSKYPMAIFSFYENGTIANISLPDNMNQTIAYSMIELIEKIIPKLSRNRTEDYINGIELNVKKNQESKTLVENHSKGEIKDIKKSKFSKLIERDIENNQLTSIRTDSNISLESQTDNGETSFGLKDCFIHEKSEIILNEIKNEKENIELIQILAQYQNFINSKALLESFDKNQNVKEDYIIDDLDKEINNSSKIRKLGAYETDTTFTVKNFNIFGVQGSIKIRFRITNILGGRRIIGLSLCYAEIIISTNRGEAKFGDEVFLLFSKTFETPEKIIFFFIFPNFMFAGVGLSGKGSLTISAKVKNNEIELSFTGKLKANAYVWATAFVAELRGGAWGTIVELSLGGAINFNGEIRRFGSIGTGEIVVYIEGKILHFLPGFYHECKVFDGWKKDF